jgi:hypothetical protein
MFEIHHTMTTQIANRLLEERRATAAVSRLARPRRRR